MRPQARKRIQPTWLKVPPFIRVQFVDDGVILKLQEIDLWMLKTEHDTEPMTGTFTENKLQIGDEVLCYYKTSSTEKEFFKSTNIEMHLDEEDSDQEESTEGEGQ